MSRCPSCNAPLTEHDLATGRCGHCQRAFSAADAQHPAPPATEGKKTVHGLAIAQTVEFVGGAPESAQDEGTQKAAELEAIGQTFDSAGSPPAPPATEGKKTVPGLAIGQTLESVGGLPQPAEAGGTQQAELEDIGQTVDSAGTPPAPPTTEGKKTVHGLAIGQTLESVGGPPASAANEGTQKAAELEAIGQTCDSGGSPPAPPAKEGKKTVHGLAIAQTLESVGGPPQPAEDGGTQKPAELEDIGQTCDSVGGPVAPPEKTGRKTTDELQTAQTIDQASGAERPGTKSLHHVPTMERQPPSEDVDQQVSLMWSEKLDPAATPRTSLKAATTAQEAGANVTIQPRILRRAGAARVQADYELMNTLGEGGMGIVVVARQASIDRLVALKMLKPAGAQDPRARRKFLSEAAVTGDLEHPNIVPVYELGADETGTLFYSMKRVKGIPWSSEINKKSFPENLEILMKVADAVAFAHSRDVIHRDLKPENVMLGDFGEVLLMDWGLAISVRSDKSAAGMAGTPTYMAPEMAFGPAEKIGITSDVYLLGAILYEIITGDPPHWGKNVMACLSAAARNEIRPTEKTGELVAIALKAMATAPEDRYPTVREFQAKIREYQSHSESISLSTRAAAELQEAERRDDYETYARARFAFQEACNLWAGNEAAREGVGQASAAYARSALRKGDYDLGATLLTRGNAEHDGILDELTAARRERDARQQRLKTAKRIGAGLVSITLVVITVAFFWIRAEADRARQAETVAEYKRQEAVVERERADQKTHEAQEQRLKAEEQADIARQQRTIAQQQTAEAVRQRTRADEQRSKAEDAQRAAETARRTEEYGAYIARIGLAAAKIDENAFDRALALLNECPAHLRDWEWGRLMHLCIQDVRTFDAQQPIDAAALSPDGTRLVTGGWGGTVRMWDVQSGKELWAIPTGGQYVLAVAFSADGRQFATGTNGRPDYVKIWDAQTGAAVKSCPGHRDAVLSIVYSRDGQRLLTSSYDETARLWDLASGESQAFQGHEWWVWSAAFSPDEKRIVTACQDGSAMVWSVETREPGPPFLGHVGPVYAAVFSPDGKHVATAGYDRRILVWEPEKVRPFAFGSGATRPADASAEYRTFEGHAAGVQTLRYSANGKLLLSGSHDNTVRVWDVASRKPLKILRGHAGRVSACAFGPDHSWVLSGSHDHLAKLWSIAGYEEVRVFQGRVLEGHSDAVLGAAFSPDGRRIVSASRDRSAKLWDAQTGRELREFREGHESLATKAAFFPDGKRLLSAAVDNTTRIWDVTTGTQLLALEETGPMAAVALSDDGRLLLTGSPGTAAKLWDAAAGKLLRTLEGHRSAVTAVAISHDNRWLLTGDARGRCRLWNAATGALQWEAEGHSRNVTAAAFLSKGEAVLTASIDNTVAQWDLRTGQERLPWILKHPASVVSMALSPDSRRVLTACADKMVRVWDVASGQQTAVLPTGGETTNAVAISPDGRQAVTTAANGRVRMWDLEQVRELRFGPADGTPGSRPGSGANPAWVAIFSPDGGKVLTVGGNEACLWDVQTGQPGMRFSPHGSVASARFSPDGKRVVTGSWDNTARIWNAETGLSELRLERAHTQFVNDAAFSADGAQVVTASDDKTACLWDARTGQVLRTLRGHEQRLSSAVFSADGKRVLTASNDKTARIWNASTGQLLHILRGHQQAVLRGVFSFDGKRVITGGEDNQARLWDAETGQELAFRLEGHTASVTGVAFSPSGHRVITGSQDQTAKIWDAETGKEILTLKGHSRELTAVCFSPDGKNALTASRDGTLVLWLATDWRPRAASTARLDR
jgi:WD40 repeat protein